MPKKRIEQVVQESDVATAEQEALEAQQPTQPEIKAGYFVGLNSEGNFIFEITGTDKGLIEVLGLHQYASERIRQIVSDNTNTGDKLTAQVGQVVLELNNKLDAVLKAVTPPQNKL